MIDCVSHLKLIISLRIYSRSNVVHILQRPYPLQVTVIVFEVHSKEELENYHAEVGPHRVSEVELIVIDIACGAEYP